MQLAGRVGWKPAWDMCAGLVLGLLLSLLCDCWPVVDRRLATFFASPKKVAQKRRRKVAALRVPNCAGQKMGNEANSPAAQTASFLIHFLPRTIGSATCGSSGQKKSQKPIQKQHRIAVTRSKRRVRLAHRLCLALQIFVVSVYPLVRTAHPTLAR